MVNTGLGLATLEEMYHYTVIHVKGGIYVPCPLKHVV